MNFLALPLVFFTLNPIIPLEKQVTNRVLFVVDCSASMTHGPSFQAACSGLVEQLQVPTDDLQFGVIGFDNRVARWPGLPDAGTPKGWASLPNEDAIRLAETWVREFATLSGDTFATRALNAAFHEPQDHLTIILLTDGEFNGPEDNTLHDQVHSWQEERRRSGKEPAVFVVLTYGGLSPIGRENVRKLGPDGHYNNE